MSEEKNNHPKQKRFPLWLFISIVFIGLVAPFGYVALSQVYSRYVEISPPVIEIVEASRGIGITPTSLKFRLSDRGAGLDEVVVRARQRGRMRELYKKKLKGVATYSDEIAFAGSKSGFQEGALEIEIVSFDQALWSNKSENTLQLQVDYRKPKVEVLTTQHNARRGGSQLVFYKVFDEDVLITGVKIGDKIFQGYRANALDPALEDPHLYLAFYAVDISQQITPDMIQVIAEDRAGNSASAGFYNKVLDRANREITVNLSDEFLRSTVVKVYERSGNRLQKTLDDYDKDPQLKDLDLLLKQFKALNEVLRAYDQKDIQNRLADLPRFESFLKQFFLRQNANPKVQFGDRLSFVSDSTPITSRVSTGAELVLPTNEREVVAINDGVVSISELRGAYGYTVAIDHGLGVSSVYAQLEELKVQVGDSVKRGDSIGIVGTSGLAMNKGVFIEMRIHGVPVDPLEWWDASWFNQHVIGKINEVKVALGLQVTKPL